MNDNTPFEDYVHNMNLGSFFRDRDNWKYLLLILVKRVALGYLIGILLIAAIRKQPWKYLVNWR